MMSKEYEIGFLADHPEFIPTLAQALHRHWAYVLKTETIDDRLEKLNSHLNREKLPIAWVAFSGGKVLGTAALRIKDLDGHDQLSPWLAGVYVGARNRDRGIGKALCRFVEVKAFEMGHTRLYLFTLDKVDWYRVQGWVPKENITWHGHPGVVMEKTIG